MVHWRKMSAQAPRKNACDVSWDRFISGIVWCVPRAVNCQVGWGIFYNTTEKLVSCKDVY